MDLLQTVRKEGSRGGRAEFSWDNVKGDAQRENYLGHSLMAPVGRWQKNKDLQWYARNDKDANGKELSEAEARREEIRRVKEAEADALARALGYDVPPRPTENPNMTALGTQNEVQKAIKESMDDNEDGDAGKGLGYHGYGGGPGAAGDDEEILAGTMVETDSRGVKWDLTKRRQDQERRSGREGDHRRRLRSRSRDKRRYSRREGRSEESRRYRSRSSSISKHRHRSRSIDHRNQHGMSDRSRQDGRRPTAYDEGRRRNRSRSPRPSFNDERYGRHSRRHDHRTDKY